MSGPPGRRARSGGRSSAVVVPAALAAVVLALTPARPAPAAPGPGRQGRGEVVMAPEAPVTAVDLSSERANNSPAVAVDPTDHRYMVLASRVDAPTFDCRLHVSGDGGLSWVPAAPLPPLPEGVDACYSPEVAFDGQGTLYLLFVGLAGPANTPVGAWLASSEARRDFTPPRRVLGPDRFMVRMAVDTGVGRRGRLHLVWLEATSPPLLGGLPPPPNPILAAHSDDGGGTFSTPVPVSDPGRRLVVAPAVAVGRDGAVHAAYFDLGEDERDYQGLEGPPWDGSWSLVTATSTDGGNSFARHRQVDGGLVPRARVMLVFTMPPPSLVADGSGRVFTSWSDARHGDEDVFVAASDDAAATWGRPSRLSEEPAGSGPHQYLPRLALSPGGRLDAVYLDRAGDPGNANHHVTYRSSVDGLAFGPGRRLSTEPSHAETGARYPVPAAAGLVELGSRLGLVSLESAVVAAWPDARNVVFKNTQQDVVARRVELLRPPARGGRAAGPLAAAGTGVAVGVALVVAGWAARRRRGARAGPGRPGETGA